MEWHKTEIVWILSLKVCWKLETLLRIMNLFKQTWSKRRLRFKEMCRQCCKWKHSAAQQHGRWYGLHHSLVRILFNLKSGPFYYYYYQHLTTKRSSILLNETLPIPISSKRNSEKQKIKYEARKISAVFLHENNTLFRTVAPSSGF